MNRRFRNVSRTFPWIALAVFLLAISPSLQLAAQAQHTPRGDASPRAPVPDGSPADTPSDREISDVVQAQFRTDELIAARDLQITVVEGVVNLSGEIESLAAKHRATRLAKTTRGVRSVINRLQIADHGLTDEQVRNKVIASIGEDPATDSWQIRINVTDGMVTLVGTVDSYAEKVLAQRVASSTIGVRGIRNELDIRTPDSRRDSEIRTEVEQRFKHDVWVDDEHLRVAVDDGVVRVTGAVPHAEQRDRVVSDAFVRGVRDVDVSGVTVDPAMREPLRRQDEPQAVVDVEIIQAVESALGYDPRTNAGSIDVAAEMGVVTLTGEVDTLRARQAAEQDAHNTLGVWDVINRIAVVGTPSEATRLQEQARRALSRDAFTSGLPIKVSVAGTAVTLTGEVGSEVARQHATNVVSHIRGVQSIDNQLVVKRTASTRIPDLDLKYKIANELYWSPFLEGTRVTVSVTDGVATLSGSVQDQYAYQAAARAARNAGAQRVINRLIIDPQVTREPLCQRCLRWNCSTFSWYCSRQPASVANSRYAWDSRRLLAS